MPTSIGAEQTSAVAVRVDVGSSGAGDGVQQRAQEAGSGEQEFLEEYEGRPVTVAQRELWLAAFRCFQHDGEIHQSSLGQALELCGHDQSAAIGGPAPLPEPQYATLSAEEFVRFVCLFEGRTERRQKEVYMDVGGGLPLDDAQLEAFFRVLDPDVRPTTLLEVRDEVVPPDSSPTLVGLYRFDVVLRMWKGYRAREGFRNAELKQFKLAFRVFDRDLSGDIAIGELNSAISWLGLVVSEEETKLHFIKSAGPRAAGLTEWQFLAFLRRVHDIELAGVRRILRASGLDSTRQYVTGKSLQQVVAGLGCNVPPCAIIEAIEDLGLGSAMADVGPGPLAPEAAVAPCRPIGLARGVVSLKGMRFRLDEADICDLMMRLRTREGFARSEWQELRTVFTRFCGGEERLSVHGVGKALRWVGYSFHLHALRDMMADVDAAGGHCTNIGFRTFVKLVRKCQDRECSKCVEVFAALDKRGGGQLSGEALREAFEAMGLSEEWNAFKAMRRFVGVDSPTFCANVQRRRKADLERRRQFAGYSTPEVDVFLDVFRRAAKFSATGEIGSQELAGLIAHFCPEYAHSADWRPSLVALMHEADNDEDGVLGFTEFLTLMRLISDQEDEARLGLELRAIEALGFSPQEVRDLRQVFQDARKQQASCGQQTSMASVIAVTHIITSCIQERGDRRTYLVDSTIAQAIRDAAYTSSPLLCSVRYMPDTGDTMIDFPIFLRIMRCAEDAGLLGAPA